MKNLTDSRYYVYGLRSWGDAGRNETFAGYVQGEWVGAFVNMKRQTGWKVYWRKAKPLHTNIFKEAA